MWNMKSRLEIGEKRDNEVSVWTVAIGNIPMFLFLHKGAKKAIDIIRAQDGFIAFLPIYPRGTLCLFTTENDAKGARNMMRFHGIQCGDNICEVYVDKRYVNGK